MPTLPHSVDDMARNIAGAFKCKICHSLQEKPPLQEEKKTVVLPETTNGESPQEVTVGVVALHKLILLQHLEQPFEMMTLSLHQLIAHDGTHFHSLSPGIPLVLRPQSQIDVMMKQTDESEHSRHWLKVCDCTKFKTEQMQSFFHPGVKDMAKITVVVFVISFLNNQFCSKAG